MEPDRQEPRPKHFHELLAGLGYGSVVARLDEELTTLLKQTQECAFSKGTTGSASGTITVKLMISVTAAGEVAIKADTSHKAPKIPNEITRRWLNPKTAEIIDHNPRQPDLPMLDGLGGTVTKMRSVP